MYFKDTFESKYQLVINEKEKDGIKELKIPKAFVDYSQTVDDVYKYLEDYNPTKKRKVLIVFDDMKADMAAKKRFIPIVAELFRRRGKLSILLVFITVIFKYAINPLELFAAKRQFFSENNQRHILLNNQFTVALNGIICTIL